MQKQCHNEACNKPFETEYPQKEYCSVRCRRTAKEHRAVLRDGQRGGEAQVEPNYYVIENATMQQFAARVLVYAAGADPKPTVFKGTLPEGHTVPKGVMFTFHNREHTEWFMKTEIGTNPMEEFMREQAKGGETIKLEMVQ